MLVDIMRLIQLEKLDKFLGEQTWKSGLIDCKFGYFLTYHIFNEIYYFFQQPVAHLCPLDHHGYDKIPF